MIFTLAFLVAQQVMYFMYRKEGRASQEVDSLTIYMVVATIVGARLGHVLFYDPLHYIQNPLEIIMIWEGGLASHGGVIGVLITLFLFARKAQVKYLWILDRISIVAALVFCFIRIGNLMNSEIIGTPTDMPWGFIFTSMDNIPRHPAQIYEAIQYFLSFILLFWIWRKRKDTMKDGFIFSLALIIMFTCRFTDEFFKISQVDFEKGMVLNMGQILSLPFIFVGIVLLILTRGKRPAIPPTVVPPEDTSNVNEEMTNQ